MSIINDGQHDRQDWPMSGTLSNSAYPVPQSMEDVRRWRECDHDWQWEQARKLCAKCGWAQPSDDTLEYAQERIANLEAGLSEAEFNARGWKVRHEAMRKFAERAEAEAERLKCCGNCQHINCDEYQECHHPQTMDDEWDRIYYVSCWDSCHFTPSRWAERGGEKPRCT